MSLKVGTEIAGILKIDTERVGLMKIGSEIIYRAPEVMKTLYIIAAVNQSEYSLFTLEPSTGVATRVGTRAVERLFSALVSNGGNLYGFTGGSGNNLYGINPTTSRSYGGIDVPMRNSISGATSHNGEVYIASFVSPSYQLYTVNVDTGVATRVGTGTFTEGDALASHNGKLYASNRWLVEVNPTTGAGTRVGTSNGFGVGINRGMSGLISYNNMLIGVAVDTDHMAAAAYSIDTALLLE